MTKHLTLLGHRMTRIFPILLFIGLAWGQDDCTADDGTEGIELWDVCYSIENTTEINLYNNQLTGSIPPEIGNLTNLNYLGLGANQLTGYIPPEIGNLTNLTTLLLGFNDLEGSIPLDIGNLTNLNFLFLGYNQLTGPIPQEIGNLTNLIELVFENNQLTGVIPESICNLNIELELNNNQLCPPYPECIEEFVGNQDTSNCSSVSIIEDVILFTYALYKAYPNPFNPVTTLRYDLPEDANVNITIYDMMGRKVKTLINELQSSGYKSVQWNGTNNQGEPVSAGVYLYKIQAGDFVDTKKMILLK